MARRPRHRSALRLAAAALALAASASLAAEPKLKEVIVVFKTHFDIGYTGFARDVVARYRTSMIDQALAVCDQSQDLPPEHRFVWTVPGWPMAQILWPDQTPERRARVLGALKSGRLVTHALPGSLHTESLELEELVRGLRFASEAARSLGQPLPRDAKMTDVPSHSWALPTVLKHAGVDFFHLGCNPAPVTPDVPPLFWWEGPDGSRLLTMYSAGNYGTSLTPPNGWPHATWLALIHTGDNHGPPTAAEVRRLLDEARQRLPGVTVRMGRLSDFADAILRENPSLPVVRGDMPDTWIHGLMSNPRASRLARNTRPAIGALESLQTLLGAWGVAAPPVRDTVAAAYERSLMYGEHTWGIDSKGFGPRLYGKAWEEARAQGRYKRLEESWDEHAAYIEKAEALVRPALEARLSALAAAVGVAGRRVVVYNPLPWPRDGLVALKASGEPIAGLKDAENGMAVPVEQDGESLRFVARGVPPMGYRTYVPAAAAAASALAADEKAATLENEFFRLTLDPARGVVASLVDKRSGRELADSAAGPGLGQYLYERFDTRNVAEYLKSYLKTSPGWAIADLGKPGMRPAEEVPYAAASPEGFSLEMRRSGVAAAALMKAPAGRAVPHAVSLAVRLYAGRPFVEFEWAVADKTPDPWPEAGWLCFPLKVEKPAFRLARLGSIVDPARDVIRSTNHDIYCLNGGLTVAAADGAGAGLCALDTPLVSLERPGGWRFSRDFVPSKPVVYVHLFNNQVSTNFVQWIGGTWSVRVRLWAVADAEGHPELATGPAGLIAPSWEARSPLLAAACEGHPELATGPAGALPPSRAGLELSRRGVLVTAFGPDPDGEGTLLRLWEMAGSDAPCRVRLPAGLTVREARPCGLRGQPLGPAIGVRDGGLDVPMRRFAPASFLLKIGD